jgi:1,2-phenylacetyl-CoA epoxidase PaaB subunit
VYLPDWYEVVARDESKGRYRDAGLSAARAQGLRILDLRKAFAERQKTATLWIASRPGYYSPDGNALVAEQIELALADMLP